MNNSYCPKVFYFLNVNKREVGTRPKFSTFYIFISSTKTLEAIDNLPLLVHRMKKLLKYYTVLRFCALKRFCNPIRIKYQRRRKELTIRIWLLFVDWYKKSLETILGKAKTQKIWKDELIQFFLPLSFFKKGSFVVRRRKKETPTKRWIIS